MNNRNASPSGTFSEDISGRYAAEKKVVLALCNKGADFSVADLARELGTSIPKATRIVSEMIREGYLVETGKQESATGRRPSLYGLNPAAGYFVGIDVGHESISLAVTDFSGQVVLFSGDIPFCLKNNEESVHQMCQLVRQHLKEEGIDENKLKAYGVNLSGRVNHASGYSYSYFISDERPISKVLETYLGKSVSVENDSRAMAYGEYLSGIASGDESTVLSFNIGWGLGMGLILDGKPFYGKSGFSGEFGHFPLMNNNQYCQCGKIGCLETAVSGRALVRIMKEKLADGRSSLLSESFREGKDPTLDDVLQAIQKEDVAAIECVEEMGATLGRAIAGLINLFNPDLVVIGGRLSVTERYLMPPLRSAVNKYSLNMVNNDTVIKVSRLGKKAGAIGASFLSKIRLLEGAS